MLHMVHWSISSHRIICCVFVFLVFFVRHDVDDGGFIFFFLVVFVIGLHVSMTPRVLHGVAAHVLLCHLGCKLGEHGGREHGHVGPGDGGQVVVCVGEHVHALALDAPLSVRSLATRRVLLRYPC